MCRMYFLSFLKRETFPGAESPRLLVTNVFPCYRSLKIARNDGLLEGYKIHVTPNVRPPPPEMKGTTTNSQ